MEIAEIIEGKCDVCGEQATNCAVNVIQIMPVDGDRFYKWKPGKERFGCDKHNPISKKIRYKPEPDKKCGECGKEPVTWKKDVTYVKAGEWRYGCMDHPVCDRPLI